MSQVIDTKKTYSLIRCCGHIRNVTKIYSDWLPSESKVVGFWGHTNSNLGKDEKLKKIQQWCDERHLPVLVINDKTHLTRFKMKLL